jgi:Origin recognition complex winged helix C-terminal/Origin recognition complex (ORC) subunit 3 N-terminus
MLPLDDDVSTGAVRRVWARSEGSSTAIPCGSLHGTVQLRVRALAQARAAMSRGCVNARRIARADACAAVAAAVRIDIQRSILRRKGQQRTTLRTLPMTALLVHLTASAAAGDRSDAFNDICGAARRSIELTSRKEEAETEPSPVDGGGRPAVGLCVLQAAYHGAMPLAVAALDEVWSSKASPLTVLVAFEDADCFPEDALRDIVHVCSTVHKDLARSVRIVLLFGLSISSEPLNAALGANESSMIAPFTVLMPSAETCFHVIVQHVLEDGSFPILLTRQVFSLLRSHFLESTSSVALLEQVLSDICSMHYFDQPLAALTTNPEVLPDHFLPYQGRDMDGGRRAERDEDFRRNAFDSTMNVQMACEFVSARLMKSVSRELPESMIHAASAVSEYLGTERTRAGAQKQVDEELRKLMDVKAISDLAFDWHSALCRWRWLNGVVRRIVWTIACAMGVSAAEVEEAIEDDELGDRPRYSQEQLRTLLFEEFLPDGETSAHHNSEVHGYLNVSSCRRRPFITVVRKKFKILDDTKLRNVLSLWIRSLEDFNSTPDVKAQSSTFSNMLSELEELRRCLHSEEFKMSSTRGPQPGNDSAPVKRNDQSEVAKSTDTDGPRRKKRKGTVDSALDDLESGKLEIANRRAKGSLAAREKRSRNLHVVPTIGERPLDKSRERAEQIFQSMLDMLQPLQSLPLHETILFSNVDKLCSFSTGFGGAAEPRKSFIRAMRRSSEDIGDLALQNTPSIAHAYEVLAEGGRMVNLSEWYHAFDAIRLCARAQRTSSLLDNTTDLDVGRSHATIGDAASLEVDTQAQFARAVAELEFLGVLKHTNRKTDHVIRLLYE